MDCEGPKAVKGVQFGHFSCSLFIIHSTWIEHPLGALHSKQRDESSSFSQASRERRRVTDQGQQSILGALAGGTRQCWAFSLILWQNIVLFEASQLMKRGKKREGHFIVHRWIRRERKLNQLICPSISTGHIEEGVMYPFSLFLLFPLSDITSVFLDG